jgi:hypothetical protein
MWLPVCIASELILLGVALCCVAPAVAASRLGLIWAVGALSAGLIPMTAVALWLAAVRAKTVATEAGLRDGAGDGEDPLPGFGLDDQTAAGGHQRALRRLRGSRSWHVALWAGVHGDAHADQADPGLLEITAGQVLDALATLPSAAVSRRGRPRQCLT